MKKLRGLKNMRTYFEGNVSFDKLKWQPIEKDGEWPDEVMTIQEFIDAVNCGAYIDYDGFGVYANDDTKSNAIVYPSDVEKGLMEKDERFTHIVWYNR
jgi:hypothetical protein